MIFASKMIFRLMYFQIMVQLLYSNQIQTTVTVLDVQIVCNLSIFLIFFLVTFIFIIFSKVIELFLQIYQLRRKMLIISNHQKEVVWIDEAQCGLAQNQNHLIWFSFFFWLRMWPVHISSNVNNDCCANISNIPLQFRMVTLSE